MAHGAGRPGQPASGQRPMFGGGSPVFAQMPVYTPVTRGPEMAPQSPQQAYHPYAAPLQPNQQPASGLSYPDPQTPSPLAYPSPHPSAAPSYQSPHPAAAPNYQAAAPAEPNYLSPHPPQAAPSHQPTEFAPQTFHPANQPAHVPNFSGAEHAGPQSYPGSSYNGAQGFTSQPFQDHNFADASFTEPPSADASFPETSFDQNFADPSFGNQNFAKPSFADASFPEPQSFDRNFSDASFPATPSYDHQEPEVQAHQSFETFAEEAPQDYGMGSGEVPQSDPRRQLQAFDALYDQPPQISLGSDDQTRRAAQDFYESERHDADFLDEGQVLPPPGARAKAAIKGRSAFMVGSALLGAIALGGALAFAYKQSGGGLSNGQPPLVTADSRPVKELPEEAGGKEFPHKNKLIYDRLQNGDEPESERLVPRQENVAVPALPPSMETTGMPAPVASTDLGAPPTTQSVGGEPIAVASVDDGTMPDGGPRRVKTMVVRPDGSVMESPEAAPPATPEMAAAAPAASPEPQLATAAVPQEVAPPAPEPKPAQQQTAAAAPQAAAAPTKYLVQVASKRNQTEALASFADMQQKYPSLLGNYRPMVQKADLGAKGVWYRLRIGPIADKTSASKLCSQLKSQGLPDCLVMAAQ
jgi:cell division septation protein DedD